MGDRGKGLPSSEPTVSMTLMPFSTLLVGLRVPAALSPLILADLKNLQCSRGCAVMADVHLELHPSGD